MDSAIVDVEEPKPWEGKSILGSSATMITMLKVDWDQAKADLEGLQARNKELEGLLNFHRAHERSLEDDIATGAYESRKYEELKDENMRLAQKASSLTRQLRQSENGVKYMNGEYAKLKKEFAQFKRDMEEAV